MRRTETAKSTAERQAAYRARQAGLSKSEVRGIYATPENAKKIRDFADELSKMQSVASCPC